MADQSHTTPKPGSRWRHYNGTPYTVLHVANEPGDDRYPLTIIYQGPNRKVWARRADDWHRSMTEITGANLPCDTYSCTDRLWCIQHALCKLQLDEDEENNYDL